MAEQLLASVDQAIDFVNKERKDNTDEKKEEEVQLLSAVGYKDQTFRKLVTKIDDNRTNESQMPLLGLGTWLSKPGKVKSAVEYALKIGYRLIDAAAIYGNEKEVGAGISAALAAGIKREDIFITSKLWNTKHAEGDVVPSLKKTLSDLGLEYVDLYLIHWPLTLRSGDENFPKNKDGSMDAGRIVPHLETWKGMEQCVKLGLTKHIGISNFNESQMENIVKNGSIKPVVAQNECHPYLGQVKLIKYCSDNDIVPQSYSPLGNPARPAGWDHSLKRVLDDPELKKIADKYNVSIADVCIRYQIDRGVVVIPKSVTLTRIKSNFQVWGFKLTEDDIKVINGLDRMQRYGIPTIINDKGKRVIRDGAHPFWPWKDTMYD
eukprot:322013_1